MLRDRRTWIGIGMVGAGLSWAAMSRRLPRPRPSLTAAAATGSFTILAAGLAAAPGKRRVEVAGVAFHAAMVPLMGVLPAPGWSKVLGQGWIAIDVAASGARLTGWPEERATALRLGGHLLAAGWIAAASKEMAPALRHVGYVVAATLGGHTLVAQTMRRPVLLMASGPLQLAWLAGITAALLRRGTTA